MLQDRPNISQLAMMRGRPVYGSDGGKLGDLEDIYYDDATGEAEWLGVGTGGILGFGAKRVLVPLEGAQVEDGDNSSVRVPYSERPEEEVRQETVRDEIRKEHVEVEDDVEDEDVEGDQGRRRR